MPPKFRSALLLTVAALPILLAGCKVGNPMADDQAKTESSANIPTIAEAPDACFRAVAKQLGDEAKVSEIETRFSVGKEIWGGDVQPKGQMIMCRVLYQDPKQPSQMQNMSMDLATGRFNPPRPIEILWQGPGETKYDIEKDVVSLSQVRSVPIPPILESQEAALDKKFSHHAWSGVILSPPGPLSEHHSLKFVAKGLLATNGSMESSSVILGLDGKTVLRNELAH